MSPPNRPDDVAGETNPFASPNPPAQAAQGKSADSVQSVFDEPHLAALYGSQPAQAHQPTQADWTGHDARMGVWNEPQFSGAEGDAPPPGSYGSWLAERIQGYSWKASVLATLGIVLLTGPTAILMALFGVKSRQWAALYPMVFGPAMEEIAKVVIALMTIELRPYVFKHSIQIALTALAGGLAFAVIENLIYLNIYIPNPDAQVIFWRWYVCTMLHVSCSCIAGIGLIRMWRGSVIPLKEPNYLRAIPFIVVAAVCHGIYNTVVIALEASGKLF